MIKFIEFDLVEVLAHSELSSAINRLNLDNNL